MATNTKFMHTPETVWCPRCWAEPRTSCRRDDGVTAARSHAERFAAAKERNEVIALDRHARHRDRVRGHAPKPPSPCGTYSAAQRHLYHNEPLDSACAAALAEYRKNTSARRRAAERDN